MNLQLLPPAEKNYPELLDGFIEDGEAHCCRWNRQGSYLAVGCRDGRCFVWDYTTRGTVRSLDGHVRAVTCVSWSHDSRYLLTSAADCNCIYWDMLNGDRRATVRFGSLVLASTMHPRRNDTFVACTAMGPVTQVRITADGRKQRRVIYRGASPEELAINYPSCLRYNRHGDRLYLGTWKGCIVILDPDTGETLYNTKITNSCIRQVQPSKRGSYLAVNATDRTIRVFQVEETPKEEENSSSISLSMLYQLIDVIERHQWNQCTFSADEEYVIGGSAHKAEHYVYIWDKRHGSLVKIVEGPKETVEDVCWHPFLPVMATVSSAGRVYLWTVHREEHWSAYAPDFTQLEENVDYVEREDEFDIYLDDQRRQVDARHSNNVDVDEEVDIVSVTDPNPYDDSDDDDGDNADTTHLTGTKGEFYIPVHPEKDPALLAGLLDQPPITSC